jgi:hypothetical protein
MERLGVVMRWFPGVAGVRVFARRFVFGGVGDLAGVVGFVDFLRGGEAVFAGRFVWRGFFRRSVIRGGFGIVLVGGDRRGRDRQAVVEGELLLDFLEVVDLAERRQFLERLQVEVIEELARRAEQGGLAGQVAMADDAHPVAILERAHDVRGDGDAADRFDLGARDRLAVGDERERLEQGARVARRLFRPELADEGLHVLAHLIAEARGDFDEFDAAFGAVFVQRFDRLGQRFRRRHLEFVEQRRQLRQRQRVRGCEQGCLDDAFDLGLFHRMCGLGRRGARPLS